MATLGFVSLSRSFFFFLPLYSSVFAFFFFLEGVSLFLHSFPFLSFFPSFAKLSRKEFSFLPKPSPLLTFSIHFTTNKPLSDSLSWASDGRTPRTSQADSPPSTREGSGPGERARAQPGTWR